MYSGIIIIDKPSDWTSFDVIAKLRGVLRERKIGHCGTLDPMATGVLPVFVTRAATKLISTYEGADKEYVAGLRLGLSTDTYDTTGNVLREAAASVTREQLDAALQGFRGDIMQKPPMYSAVKIDGQRLYKIARRGAEVEREPRPVTVSAAEIISGGGADWVIRFAVSKGTYVRSLCNDIGDALGCGGAMSSLRRTRVGGFRIENALTLEQVIEFADAGTLEEKFINPRIL
ncbi:MAG: tRNA pseudouridine(55) synthase TruB [Oscillospiraceae bacterium]|jgi:tRNA pseudouridine55 synthase|nr:tRNA pseudouridine(55) synthase TruB [Oscillospiraceae bacterium]